MNHTEVARIGLGALDTESTDASHDHRSGEQIAYGTESRRHFRSELSANSRRSAEEAFLNDASMQQNAKPVVVEFETGAKKECASLEKANGSSVWTNEFVPPEHVQVRYGHGDSAVEALAGVNLSIGRGDLLALVYGAN